MRGSAVAAVLLGGTSTTTRLICRHCYPAAAAAAKDKQEGKSGFISMPPQWTKGVHQTPLHDARNTNGKKLVENLIATS